MIGLGSLLSAFPDPPEFKHISDFQLEGMRDEIWIPSFAKDGWILITADGGKNGTKKGAKLPKVCHAHRMTHIVLSSKLHHQSVKDKILSLAAVWNEIVKLGEEPLGSRFSLRFNHTGTSVLLVKIELADNGFPIPHRRRRATEN